MTTSSSSSSSMGQGPCAACKAHRRKCTPDCVFAPLLPADQPQKFAIIHTVYGGSNVAKLLRELPPEDRAGAIHSLLFEADCRLRDPVYGVVGSIYLLQQQLKHLQSQILAARQALSFYDNNNDDITNDVNVATGSIGFGEYPPPQQVVSGFYHQGETVGPGGFEADVFGLTAQLGLLEVEGYRQGGGGDMAMLFRREEPFPGTGQGGSLS